MDKCFAQYSRLFQGPRQAGSAIDGNISDVCAVDLDNDGDLDLVTVYPAGPELAICYNDGSASFSQPWYVNENAGTADLVQSVAVGDLDGDGDIDLVSGTWNGFFGVSGDENSVAINLNKGDGTFAKATMIPVLNKTTKVITGDFDNDNDIDIAATHKDTSRISVLLNNGDATFAPFIDYEVGKDPWSLYSADINGDGYLDLIVATISGELTLLINNRDGSFSTEKILLEPGLQNVHGGDIDNDGDHDLITLNSYNNTLNIFFNDGNASFTSVNTLKMNHWINSVFLSDLNGDGNLDFCVANYDTNTVSIFMGDGSSSFAEVGEWFIGDNPHDILVADLNNDGSQDIISCANGIWAMTILNKGNFAYETIDRFYKIESSPVAIESADFNGDGFNDIIYYQGSHTKGSFLSIRLNDGYGYFPNEYSFGGDYLKNEGPSTGSPIHPFSIADYDGDGDIDIAAALNASWLVDYVCFKIFFNDGSGNFNRDETKYEVPNFTFNQINFMKSSDLDRDGDIDIIASWGKFGKSTGVSVFYNNGNAQFDSSKIYYRIDNCVSHIHVLEVADLNKDNYDDIVITDDQNFNQMLIILFNKGDGSFKEPLSFPAQWRSTYTALVAQDYDNDGDNDLALVYQTTAMIGHKGQIYVNDGFGTFTKGSDLFFPGQSPSWAEVSDIDKDGDIDIIVCTNWNKCITVNINDGDGTFDDTPPLQFSVIKPPTSLTITDFDNDGFDDVATVNSDGTLTILMNALDQPVPVELFSFQAFSKENQVLLKWFTVSERKNLGFEIQRSENQGKFNKIGFVKGHGTTIISHAYQFEDKQLSIRAEYRYRLKQIDLNGSFSYSAIISVTIGLPETFLLSQNYPNPFNPVTSIKYQLPKDCSVILKVFNLIGQEVATLVDDHQKAGYYTIQWDASNQASGMYFYLLKTSEFSKLQKMLLLR